MCGIQAGTNFTHEMQFSEEEGTLWYHAHSDWTRWTVHGAVVVYPKVGATYPFPKPDKEYEVVISKMLLHAFSYIQIVVAMYRKLCVVKKTEHFFTLNGIR